MMGVVGGKEAFEEGRKDLEQLAGVRVSTKAVERTSEEVGKDIEAVAARQAQMVVSGQVVPIESRTSGRGADLHCNGRDGGSDGGAGDGLAQGER